MGLNPTDTVLHQVRIRAGVPTRAAAIADELRRASWPSRSDHAWVFLRSVQVRSPRMRIGQRAAEAAREMADRAVDGRLPGAASADAVRFESLSELLALLLRDIAAGRADAKWYWQRWMRLFRLPSSDAITQLLSEHADRMLDVVEELDNIDAVAAVWRKLSPGCAKQLLTELSRATQTRLYVTRSASRTAAAHESRVEADPRADTLFRARFWPAIVRRWRAPLSDTRIDEPRFHLATALVALQRFSVFLSEDPIRTLTTVGVILHRRIADSAGGEIRKPSHGSEVRVEPNRGSEETTLLDAPLKPDAVSVSLPAPSMESDAAISTQAPRSDVSSGSFVAMPAVAAQETTERSTDPPDPELGGGGTLGVEPSNHRTVRKDKAVLRISSRNPPLSDHSFHTSQGGVFYLINALNHPSVRTVLDEAGAWTRLPSGWAWLFRLGECLGLDKDDPVVAFFARESGFDSILPFDELPELPLRDTLLPLFERLYSARGIWQADLLNVEGDVLHSASHVDVEFPMSAVRLPVRLAGLDINPSWVRWLGRVVTFHYLPVPLRGQS